MSRAGAARQALGRLIDAGMTGTYAALALAAGLTPEQAQSTLKEMSRCGQASAHSRCRVRPGRPGADPAVYGRPVPALDALAHVRQVWR